MSIAALAAVPNDLRAKKIAAAVARTGSLYAAMGEFGLEGSRKKDCVKFLRMLDRALEQGFLRVYPIRSADYAAEYLSLVRLGRWHMEQSGTRNWAKADTRSRLHLPVPDEVRCAQAISGERVSPANGSLCGRAGPLVGEPAAPAPDLVCALCVASAAAAPTTACRSCGSGELILGRESGEGSNDSNTPAKGLWRQCRKCRHEGYVGPFVGDLSEIGVTGRTVEDQIRNDMVDMVAGSRASAVAP